MQHAVISVQGVHAVVCVTVAEQWVNAVPPSGLTASASQQPCVVIPPSGRGLLHDTFSSFKSIFFSVLYREGRWWLYPIFICQMLPFSDKEVSKFFLN